MLTKLRNKGKRTTHLCKCCECERRPYLSKCFSHSSRGFVTQRIAERHQFSRCILWSSKITLALNMSAVICDKSALNSTPRFMQFSIKISFCVRSESGRTTLLETAFVGWTRFSKYFGFLDYFYSMQVGIPNIYEKYWFYSKLKNSKVKYIFA